MALSNHKSSPGGESSQRVAPNRRSLAQKGIYECYFAGNDGEVRVLVGVSNDGMKTALYICAIPSTQPASSAHRRLQGGQDRRISRGRAYKVFKQTIFYRFYNKVGFREKNN